MLALFGEGLRPDANAFIAERVAAGVAFEKARVEARLGRRFAQYDNKVPLAKNVPAAYARFERDHHRRPSVEERRLLKECIALALLQERRPGEVITPEVVRDFIADELGRSSTATALA